MRILVADDNRDAAETLALYLECVGHQATAVFDGQAAVEAAAATRFDAVILDLAMPGLDGYAAGQAIRRLRPGVLLVALSGHVQPHHVRRTKEAGFDVHLAKPATLPDLLQILQSAKAEPAPDEPPPPKSLVQLRDGGPVMFLEAASGDAGRCFWFDEQGRREGTFPRDRLRSVDRQKRTWAGEPPAA